MQGAEAGCGLAVGAVGSGRAQSPGVGAAIPQGAQIPLPPWSCRLWELKEKVIGNGLPWGYPSSRGCVCAYMRVCLPCTYRASYWYPHGALATQTNTGELREDENPKHPRP